MTALPLPDGLRWPLTVDDYAAQPEDDERCELQEGLIVMSPSPQFRHQDFLFRLAMQLYPCLPPGLRLVLDIDLDLQLVPPAGPGTVRRPDLVVVTDQEVARVAEEGGILRAEGAVLVVEIHSPGAVRRDTVIKHGEYADAGIGHYWMIDLDGGPSLTACHLGGAFGYVDDTPVTRQFATDSPFPVRLDLSA